MPVRKEDTQRALRLLQSYRSRLNANQQPLLKAIDRLISVFQSKLFSALLDIHEFYEDMLDENVPTPTQSPSLPPPSSRQSVQPVIEEIVLNRRDTGFGFSIAGGTDAPHKLEDPGVFVTKIIPGGSAEANGRLKADDELMEVNGVNVVSVTHGEAVEALKRSGNQMKLLVRRHVPASVARSSAPSSVRSSVTTPRPSVPTHVRVKGPPSGKIPTPTPPQPARQPASSSEEEASSEAASEASSEVRRQPSTSPPPPLEDPPAPDYAASDRVLNIELAKGPQGLGFSIAGGIGNERIDSDPGIFITKVTNGGAAESDGRISVGDRLLQVDNHLLAQVTHEEAVSILKNTGNLVQLVIVKQGRPPIGPTATPLSYPSPPPPAAIRPTNVQTSYSRPPVTQPEMEEEDDERAVRTVVLHRDGGGLGINIIGGERNSSGIFVSHVQPNKPAHQSGQVFVGDKLIQVNGIEVTGASHEQAATLLKSAGNPVTLILAHCPHDFAELEASLDAASEPPVRAQTAVPVASQPSSLTATPKLSHPSPMPGGGRRTSSSNGSGSGKFGNKPCLFVRALFEYEPSKDSGLPGRGIAFTGGDILRVTNWADDEWWQARLVIPSTGAEGSLGVVPSRRRVERKERARLKRVNFDGSATPQQSKKGSRKPAAKDDKSADDIPVPTYESVVQQPIEYTRPVIILGPLKNRLIDDLSNDYPDHFVTSVPHTTRPRRDHEIDGQDYYFVESREAMERAIQKNQFIEAGQYSGNLYGTHVNSVREVALNGRHCLLDVSGSAIERLHAADLHPVAIIVRPGGVEQLMDMSGKLSEGEAVTALDKLALLEEEFAAACAATVTGDGYDDVYQRVREVIEANSGPCIWLPSGDPLP